MITENYTLWNGTQKEQRISIVIFERIGEEIEKHKHPAGHTHVTIALTEGVEVFDNDKCKALPLRKKVQWQPGQLHGVRGTKVGASVMQIYEPK